MFSSTAPAAVSETLMNQVQLAFTKKFGDKLQEVIHSISTEFHLSRLEDTLSIYASDDGFITVSWSTEAFELNGEPDSMCAQDRASEAQDALQVRLDAEFQIPGVVWSVNLPHRSTEVGIDANISEEDAIKLFPDLI